jgi:hypothetical protein
VTQVDLVFSSELYSPNSCSLNMRQRQSTKTIMHAEWSPTRPHPLFKCVISLFVILRSKTGPTKTLYHSQPVPRMPMHRICLPNKLARFCLPAIMITFPAVPHSFGLILTFSMSPDLRLEPGGVLVYRPDFPQPRSLDHHKLRIT